MTSSSKVLLLILVAMLSLAALSGCASGRVEHVEHDTSRYQELAPGMYSVKQSQGFERPLAYEPWEQLSHIPLGEPEDAARERSSLCSRHFNWSSASTT